MRNIDLVDAVIKLHDIARLVEVEIGKGNLSDDLRGIADRLHALSVEQNRASYAADEIIKQVKE
jgi:hypothetical protein